MKPNKNDIIELRDILEAIHQIIILNEGLTWETFKANPQAQQAVAAQMASIGQSAGQISDTFQSQFPEIPWQDLMALREIDPSNFETQLDRLWVQSQGPLPDLQSSIGIIINDHMGL